jgi:hypothetical protein
MEAKDFRQRIIKEGARVKYLGTRTTGRVQQIMVEGEHVWIKMDSTGLFYRSDYLLLVDGDLDLKKNNRKLNAQEKIEKLKRIAPTEISDHGDGPGYGGG